jgi:hypothetical protein
MRMLAMKPGNDAASGTESSAGFQFSSVEFAHNTVGSVRQSVGGKLSL